MIKKGVPPTAEAGVEIKKLTKTEKNRTGKNRKVIKEKGRETLETTTNR